MNSMVNAEDENRFDDLKAVLKNNSNDYNEIYQNLIQEANRAEESANNNDNQLKKAIQNFNVGQVNLLVNGLKTKPRGDNAVSHIVLKNCSMDTLNIILDKLKSLSDDSRQQHINEILGIKNDQGFTPIDYIITDKDISFLQQVLDTLTNYGYNIKPYIVSGRIDFAKEQLKKEKNNEEIKKLEDKIQLLTSYKGYPIPLDSEQTKPSSNNCQKSQEENRPSAKF